MRLLVLTSSRADYGIYFPLLKKLKADSFFQMDIVVFGTHLSEKHGNTLETILNDGFEVKYKIETLAEGDGPESLVNSMALTMSKLSKIWKLEQHKIDWVLSLGDRYEMFAAVSSTVPFNIPIVHFHGGEKTEGAIDDVFRHSITMMSQLHFTSTEKYKQRVVQMTGREEGIYNVGSMSLDNLKELSLLSHEEFFEKFGIELNNPILVTFHPQTRNYEETSTHIEEVLCALEKTNQQIIFTMPNADTAGNIIRTKIKVFASQRKNTHVMESFGTLGYFSCIKYCDFVLGNSSSGIIEVASFGKYVINVGARQKGREIGNNVLNCEINRQEIIEAINKISTLPDPGKNNIYGNGSSSEKVIEILKQTK